MLDDFSRRARLALLALVFCVVWFAVPVATYAQQQRSELAARISSAIEPLRAEVDALEAQVASPGRLESDLTSIKGQLDQLNGRILSSSLKFQPDLVQLNRAIDRLAPATGETESQEPPTIVAERQALVESKTKALIALRDAENLSVRVAKLTNRVLEQRRSRFVSSLLERQVINGAVVDEVLVEAPQFFAKARNIMARWISASVQFRGQRLLIFAGLMVIFALALWRMLRPMRRWVERIEQAGPITSLQKITLAFFSTILPGAAISILMFAAHLLLHWLGIYTLQIDRIVSHILIGLTSLAFIWLLLTAVLSPGQPARRLLTIDTSGATRLRILIMVFAAIYAVDYVFSQLFIILSASVSLTIVKSFLSALLMAITLVAILFTRLKPMIEGPRSGYRGWNLFAYWLCWAAIVAIILLELAGFISLGRYIAGQVLITGTILVTAFIGFRASRAIAEHNALMPTRLGQRLSQRYGLGELRIDQVGLLLSVLINTGIVLIGIPLLAVQYGIQADEITTWFGYLFTGFTLGGVEISILKILLAMLVFSLLIIVTRIVQRWFDSKVFSRTRIDMGVQNSMRAGIGYVGYFIAALVGLSWAGLNLSNVALIAGALSVGIGFGLQNIVNNFVSGVIMLIERPIKVGDIIAVGANEGFVRKINVRATELETFDRQSVIIPNSEVINTSVGNWMHADHVRRIIIRIGVAYGSDVEVVRDVLASCVEGDKRISADPAPFVFFADFGNSSLDFQLRFFINDIMQTPVVESEVRFRIHAALAEAGIEIPFPQTDLHIRSGLDVLNARRDADDT